MEQVLGITTEIAMPTSSRGNGINRHDANMAKIKPSLEALTVIGSSFLLPYASYQLADKARRDLNWLANTKYGKVVGKSFVVKATDFVAAIAATEEVTLEDGTIIPAIAAKEAIPAGIRFWLASI